MRVSSAIALVWAASCALTSSIAGADEGFWLYSAPPTSQVSERYAFELRPAWLDHLMRASAALVVAPNLDASGSFVSADGLFLTTYHTARQFVDRLNTDGTTYARTGFVARTPAEELRIPRATIRSPRSFDRYQEYTDVRLVFCPEEARALVRDPPGSHLDACLFRVYDNGRPARTREFLRLADEPARPGEVVFASGNPIRSERHRPFASLRFERDVMLPVVLEAARALEVALLDWSRNADGNPPAEAGARAATRVRSSRERRLALLWDPAFLAKKTVEEADVRRRLATAGDRLAPAPAADLADFRRYHLLEAVAGFDAETFDFARLLWRRDEVRARRDADRVDQWLRSEQKIDDAAQRVRLAAWLGLLIEKLGYEDPTVRKVLGDKSPQARVDELVSGTRVGDRAFREMVLDSDAAAIARIRDPMIELVRSIDAEARALLQANTAREALEASLVKVSGVAGYPEASGTLRLSYGVVKLVALNGETTIDAIGGSSGSPVVNAANELVGVMRGRSGSATGGLAYDDDERSSYVASSAIVDALRTTYDARHLANELVEGSRRHR